MSAKQWRLLGLGAVVMSAVAFSACGSKTTGIRKSGASDASRR